MRLKLTADELRIMQELKDRDVTGETYCITCERYTIFHTCACMKYRDPSWNDHQINITGVTTS